MNEDYQRKVEVFFRSAATVSFRGWLSGEQSRLSMGLDGRQLAKLSH